MSYEKLPIAEHDSLQKNYSSFEQNHSEVTLSFHDLHYEVSKKMDDAPVCGKTAMVEILSGVSGWLPPGLNAIMGPTGSGKSSLLDILAQRKNPKGLKEGLVLLNGEKPPKDFRLMSGYVVQDDIVMGTLTVRENLTFSANLRLSNKQYNKTARKAKVEEVIIQLGLEACADTLVGTEFVRGVSGGERKRVNIGMEMILDPPVLFMDEPTTGLDSNTANSIMLLLHKLSSGGRNIIISIHQPRYSIFSLFDRLIILNKGQIVYRGPAKTSVNYFRDIGYICPRFLNPADFFLDIVGGDVSTAKLLNRLKSGASSDEAIDQAECETTSISVESDGAKNNTMHLLEEFQKSEITKEENEKLAAIQNIFYSQQNSPGDEYDALKASYSNGFFVQLNSVVRRTVLNILRNPMTSFVQFIMTMVFGILIGIIYFKMDTSFQSGLQNRSGIFFFLITSQVMSNLSALEIFILNRSYFIHESASGYYRVSVFFIAQVFADLIPNRLIPQLFFCTVVYFMAAFSNSQQRLNENKASSNLYFLLILGELLQGIGSTVLFPLSSSYVDDFSTKNSCPMYLGTLFTMQNIGPGIGYLLGAWTSTLPLHFYKNLTGNDYNYLDKRIGAWWFGYAITSGYLVIISVPLFFFPNSMATQNNSNPTELSATISQNANFGLSKKNKLKRDNLCAPILVDRSTIGYDWKDVDESGHYSQTFNAAQKIKTFCQEFYLTLRRLFTNSLYLSVVFGYTGLMFVVGTMTTFMPKFLEVVFNVSAGSANLYFGIAVFAMCIGVFVGGIIVNRIKWSQRRITNLVVGSSILSLFTISGTFFVSCSSIKPQSKNHTYVEDEYLQSLLSFTSESFLSNENEMQKCFHSFVIFICLTAFGAMIAATMVIPIYTLILRSVNQLDKCTAIGGLFLFIRAFGLIPASILTGVVVDKTCLKWKLEKEFSSNCLSYDTDKMRIRYLSLITMGVGVTTTCNMVASFLIWKRK